MTQKHTIVITVISVLVFVALIIAGLASNPHYRDRVLKAFPFLTVSPAPQASSSRPPAYVAPQRTLTPDEQDALKIPLHSASAEEKQQHTQEVARIAKTAPALDITGCKPTPLVYKIDIKGTLKIKNSDAIPHSLRYLTSQIAVPAHGTTTVKTSQLFKAPGDYGYGCDNPFAKQGVFMVR